LCNFLHSPVTSSLLGPNILLRTLFSNTLSLCSSLSVRDQISHPYETTGRITVFVYFNLYIPGQRARWQKSGRDTTSYIEDKNSAVLYFLSVPWCLGINFKGTKTTLLSTPFHTPLIFISRPQLYVSRTRCKHPLRLCAIWRTCCCLNASACRVLHLLKLYQILIHFGLYSIEETYRQM
jgi:hypothetical protein